MNTPELYILVAGADVLDYILMFMGFNVESRIYFCIPLVHALYGHIDSIPVCAPENRAIFSWANKMCSVEGQLPDSFHDKFANS